MFRSGIWFILRIDASTALANENDSSKLSENNEGDANVKLDEPVAVENSAELDDLMNQVQFLIEYAITHNLEWSDRDSSVY